MFDRGAIVFPRNDVVEHVFSITCVYFGKFASQIDQRNQNIDQGLFVFEF